MRFAALIAQCGLAPAFQIVRGADGPVAAPIGLRFGITRASEPAFVLWGRPYSSNETRPPANPAPALAATPDRARTALDYKWITLSNTTLGVFMAFANTNIVLIAMPAILQAIHIDPLAPAESNYFLWLFLGYMVMTASLLVTCGRISDLYGRVRFYNLGFAVFTLGSILLTCTAGEGNSAALQLISYRLIQGLISEARWQRA